MKIEQDYSHATPAMGMGRRREKPHLVVRVRLAEWGRWKFHQNKVNLGFSSVCPMFSAVTPRSYVDNNGQPLPAIQEVIDAVKVQTTRRQEVLAMYYVDRLTIKQIAPKIGVSESRAYRIVESAIDNVAHALAMEAA